MEQEKNFEQENINFENNEVNNEKLDDVSGGAYWYAGKYAQDPEHPWEVIDDETGEIMGSYATKRQAKQEAKLKGSSTVRYYRLKTLNKKYDAWKQHDEFSDLKQQSTGYKNPY